VQTLITVLAAVSPLLIVLLGGVGYLYRHERERREDAEKQVSERKHQAYLSVLNIYFDLMKPENRGKPAPKHLADEMFDANKELMLFGSDGVVMSYLDWFQELRRGTMHMERLGELVVAIRRDMGHPKTALRSEAVLRHLITDYDEAKASGQLSAMSVPIPLELPSGVIPAHTERLTNRAARRRANR
jgi:hypothetical protein